MLGKVGFRIFTKVNIADTDDLRLFKNIPVSNIVDVQRGLFVEKI